MTATLTTKRAAHRTEAHRSDTTHKAQAQLTIPTLVPQFTQTHMRGCPFCFVSSMGLSHTDGETEQPKRHLLQL